MITLKTKARRDNKVMRALKLSEIRHVIAHTSKGDLCLMLRFEGTERDYRFVLDAVPLSDKENKEMMELFDGVLFEM